MECQRANIYNMSLDKLKQHYDKPKLPYYGQTDWTVPVKMAYRWYSDKELY